MGENDKWTWEGIEFRRIAEYGGIGVFATCILLAGYFLFYGGEIISILDGEKLKRRGGKSAVKGKSQVKNRHHYLTFFHKPPTTRGGRPKRAYVDGHPSLLTIKGLKKYAWPAVYVNQANYKNDINCRLVELGPTRRPPISLCQQVGIDLAVSKLGVMVTKTIYPGTELLMDYRMGMGTQMRRKFGIEYTQWCECKHEETKETRDSITRTSRNKKQQSSTETVNEKITTTQPSKESNERLEGYKQWMQQRNNHFMENEIPWGETFQPTTTQITRMNLQIKALQEDWYEVHPEQLPQESANTTHARG